MEARTGDRPRVAVLGGAVAGLAAAERFREFAEVELFERQSYADKRVNCGEAINEAPLVPLEHTPENGFLNRVREFDVAIHRSTDRAPGDAPLARIRLAAERGYVTDRDRVERRWAERLRADNAVTVHEGTAVDAERYRELRAEYDYLVDATGQPSLTTKVRGETDRYTGRMVALNADVRGEFPDPAVPRVVFEGYLGYFWVFPKSGRRANVGIGWAGEDRPEDYMAALRAACDRAGVPRPDRAATSVYTIPKGPSLAPRAARPEPGVFLVGDAAGVANRYQGEGICQAVRSSYLLAELVRRGRGEAYPDRLYAAMRREYQLATLMRAVVEEAGDVDLLARVARAIDGLTVLDVTRRPRRVYARLLRRPGLLARLLREPGMRRRLWAAYTDRWEYADRDDDAPAGCDRSGPGTGSAAD